ncbi:hypothetical protein ACX9R5_06590 [Rathayibacter sp. CAU 1779]
MQEMTPLPGDPSALLSRANDLASSAEQIQHAINNLKRLADTDETISQAVDAVRGKAKDVADNITKAHTRYSGTAAALQDYAPKLDAAQQRANKAITAYESAGNEVQHAQHGLNTAQQNFQPSDPTAPTNEWALQQQFAQSPEGVRAQQAVHDAQAAVSAAQKEWWAAFHEMTDAAKHAASLINEAMDDSHLNDGFWDKVGAAWSSFADWAKKHLGPVLDILQKIAAEVGNIAGVLAMVFGVLGVFFPAFEVVAAFFETVALVASIVSFALTAVLALMGDRTWGDVLATGVVAALSVLGASKLGGKLGDLVGSKVGRVLGEGAGVRAAGRAAIEAEGQGATFAQQAVVADLIHGDVVRTISTNIGHVGEKIFAEGTDVVIDNVMTNAGGALDHATGQKRPEGLWTAPPYLTPEVNFFPAEGDGPEIKLGILDPVQFAHDSAASAASMQQIVSGTVETSAGGEK